MKYMFIEGGLGYCTLSQEILHILIIPGVFETKRLLSIG